MRSSGRYNNSTREQNTTSASPVAKPAKNNIQRMRPRIICTNAHHRQREAAAHIARNLHESTTQQRAERNNSSNACSKNNSNIHHASYERPRMYEYFSSSTSNSGTRATKITQQQQAKSIPPRPVYSSSDAYTGGGHTKTKNWWVAACFSSDCQFPTELLCNLNSTTTRIAIHARY